MEVFDRHGMRASVLLNSEMCDRYPAVIEEGKKRNWEFLGHGITNSIKLSGLSEEEERVTIRKVIDDIGAAVGTPPKGWLGPALAETFATPDLLAEEGIEYLCDWCCDDQPFPMRVRKNRLISLPYSLEINDLPAYMNAKVTPPEFARMIVDQFDQLYAEGASSGRVMCIAVHPYLSGVPHRIKYLDEALDYICRHEQVWRTTSGEIAAWYYEHYYSPPA
jgi:peptidoglycan/xylan/chitin deacetylase (PgdA/CDA1 family)